nr:unnamed protein product [Digitaria exilis]
MSAKEQRRSAASASSNARTGAGSVDGAAADLKVRGGRRGASGSCRHQTVQGRTDGRTDKLLRVCALALFEKTSSAGQGRGMGEPRGESSPAEAGVWAVRGEQSKQRS